MRTTYKEIEEMTNRVCEMLNERTDNSYRGQKGHYKATYNNSGISFVRDGESGEDKVIYTDSRNTYEHLQTLIAIRDALDLIR